MQGFALRAQGVKVRDRHEDARGHAVRDALPRRRARGQQRVLARGRGVARARGQRRERGVRQGRGQRGDVGRDERWERCGSEFSVECLAIGFSVECLEIRV